MMYFNDYYREILIKAGYTSFQIDLFFDLFQGHSRIKEKRPGIFMLVKNKEKFIVLWQENGYRAIGYKFSDFEFAENMYEIESEEDLNFIKLTSDIILADINYLEMCKLLENSNPFKLDFI